MASTATEMRAYMKAHPEFEDIGNRMLQEWDQGAAHSLRPSGRAALS